MDATSGIVLYHAKQGIGHAVHGLKTTASHSIEQGKTRCQGRVGGIEFQGSFGVHPDTEVLSLLVGVVSFGIQIRCLL